MLSICAVAIFTGVLVQAQVANFNLSGQFDVLQHLSGVSPYYISQWPAPRSPDAPQGCNITRVGAAIRHGEIYSNSNDLKFYVAPFLEKIGNLSKDFDWSKVPNLEFLATWQNPINPTEDEMVTQNGFSQAMLLGRYFANNYQNLSAPNIWASSANRTQNTAQEFARGYTGANNTNFIVVPEGEEEGANTLSTDDSCPAYDGGSGVSSLYSWLDIWTAPITARLNAQIQLGGNTTLNNGTALNITGTDIEGMMKLCGYESAIKGSSPFCSLDLFKQDEWLSFDYGEDLNYHYSSGYGSRFSGSQGIPWLVATSQLMLSQNASQEAYYSFVHREAPSFIYVAAGLFNNTAFSGGDVNATMPLNMMNPTRQWQSSKFLTYLTNIAVERLECNSYGFQSGNYFRIVTSGTPQVLENCSDGPSQSCAESTFTNWLQDRQNLFPTFSNACDTASEYSNSTDILSIYNSP